MRKEGFVMEEAIKEYSGEQVKRQLSSRLRELRIKREMSQKDVAEQLHMSRSTYTYYEAGRTLPDLVLLLKLAKLYRLPLNELLRGLD